MPELPEVETTRRGVAPHVLGRAVVEVRVREPRLRWPVPPELAEGLTGQRIQAVERRGKYLLFATAAGTLLLHLGMSGSLRVLPHWEAPARHAHVDLGFEHGHWLRYTDPRRFGSLHWWLGDPLQHPLLAHLGPEPLAEEGGFDGAWLYARAKGRRVSVKALLMDSRTVVGVGNIYANEALFLAGIRPDRAAGRISRARYERLAQTVREVLARAIEAGGTTLRDFTSGEGKPGYFAQQLHVYGRGGQPCPRCGDALREQRLGQRATTWCPRCQR
ncbi:bifunctional DNA-formamidopyrimidine glycosylase/DNA-(apurinic or apyrimidinic site) lyase [Alkalilimnicola sp. S0819]|uniref:bifunctional DNA-formamidopyrimidine glycosylase/DNA-(apurinic or apyrimidinic site) lyase n=1 Tax=Alkalilimnicola sp. S0819 TaxID=2613922 RepID=UPI0012617E70|nr:bifunctional DNA-formamidopyrimidine glycosylase/DNA-(apurinic or apyrimidinic site) lyase [Alkalilimnicola sp. S0819]KAB7627356.1 bifunctional DNA-formamidopyrimidine glycosylase/DNA-(apurinic or apyrimidinic site) lyase [Alkalilimnicola sp. S0819]MPQ16074.1 bifunctional DNA-formamidopyrimidine glycosylase/DNA-(apurinic or apyrimidinic site) lyase [Alkalilimnicola sp. S0819]